jgi:hypothetical protein
MVAQVLNPGTGYGFIQIAQPQISPNGWFNQFDTVAQNPIGGKTRWGNVVLRYVKIDVTVVPVIGAPLYALAFTPGGTSTAVPALTVGADYDGSGATLGLQVMGVLGPFTLTLPTAAYFGWIQIGGVAQVVSTGITATSNVLIGSTTDNQFAVIADGSNLTNIPAARVMGASVAGLAPALLMNMDW